MTIFEMLVDPSTKQKLAVDQEKEQIQGIDENLFSTKIENGIPVILPKKVSDTLAKSGVHKQAGSAFDYLDHYHKDAELFDYSLEYDNPVTWDEVNRLRQKVVAHIPKDAAVVLDVGCGGGWLAKKVVNDSTKVVSMDISLANPLKALRNNPHPNHYGLVADVFNLPIADGAVDCVVAAEIIEHVPAPKLFVQKLLSPLKKGGKLIITTPYNENIMYHLCVHCNRPTPANAHLHSFNEKNIGQLIPDNVRSWKYEKFANKYFPKMRVYLLIKNWPFKIWERIDRVVNKIVKHPTRLMIEIEK